MSRIAIPVEKRGSHCLYHEMPREIGPLQVSPSTSTFHVRHWPVTPTPLFFDSRQPTLR